MIMIKMRIIVFRISFNSIGPINGTTTPNNKPCKKPKTPPAIAASVNLRDEDAVLERAVQIFPTRNAISHAIGVTQITPGYPANVTKSTVTSHGRNWRSGVSKIIRRSSALEGGTGVVMIWNYMCFRLSNT